MTFAIQPADKQFAPPGPSPKSYVTESGPPKSMSQAHAENMAAAYSPFGDPFVPALHGLLTSQADGSITVIPSAGTQWSPTVTGDDAVQINTALQYTNEVRLIGAPYNIASTINLGWNQIIRGMGQSTVLNFTGTGDCIRQFNPTVASQNYSNQLIQSGGIKWLMLDGSGGSGTVNGYHVGDGLAYRAFNVQIRNFSGTGLWLDNTLWWTEKGIFVVEIMNCGTQITISQSNSTGSTTNSFEYNHLEAHLYVASGQQGIVVQGGAQWDGPGGFYVSGNVQNGANAFLTITGQNSGGAFSKIYDCPLYIRAETASGAAVGPSISFGSASNLIQECTGYLSFLGVAGGTWGDAVNATGLQTFRGRINDPNSPTQPSKLVQQQGQQSTATPGVPATGTTILATVPTPSMVYLTASGVTWTAGGIQLNGAAITPFGNLPASGLVTFLVNPGSSVTLNYSAGTITWAWVRVAGY